MNHWTTKQSKRLFLKSFQGLRSGHLEIVCPGRVYEFGDGNSPLCATVAIHYDRFFPRSSRRLLAQLSEVPPIGVSVQGQSRELPQHLGIPVCPVVLVNFAPACQRSQDTHPNHRRLCPFRIAPPASSQGRFRSRESEDLSLTIADSKLKNQMGSAQSTIRNPKLASVFVLSFIA